jgi:hypothetical protein
MKKSLLYIVAMLVLFALPIVFTSCSGSYSEDEDPAVDSKNTKIEVSFSGDYGKFSPVVSFYAYDLQGSGLSMQTPDGTKNTEWTKSYEDTPFSTASAEIHDYFSNFNVAILFTNPASIEGEVTITGKVYYDDKLYRSDSQKVVFNSGKQGVVYTYSPKSGFVASLD